ncbi:MAG: PEPxxWA-CTERM sorting domain-containing protein [Janthinobacterium lividum]
MSRSLTMMTIAGLAAVLAAPASGLAVIATGFPPPAIGFDLPPPDGGPDFTDVARHAPPPPLAKAFGTLAVVPEPRVWLLLIAGYGMVGFALRRRGLLRHVAG